MQILAHWLGSVPDIAVPYALAALGLILTERSGVLALGAEGYMLMGALAGVGAQLAWGETFVSLAAGMAAAAAVSVLFAVMVVVLRTNQVIAGLALVFFCEGLTSLLGTLLNWTSRPVTAVGALSSWLPSSWPLSRVPVLGPLFIQNPVVYLTPAVFLAVAYYLKRTHSGLRLRAVGENPQAADAAGISVARYRFAAVIAGAAIVGLAGAYISVMSVKLWQPDVTGGRGWIAVALVIFARWSPWRALAGALLFAGFEALIPQLAAAGVRLPQYFVLMSPYLVTLGVMIWISHTSGGAGGLQATGGAQPGALGQPYVREERR